LKIKVNISKIAGFSGKSVKKQALLIKKPMILTIDRWTPLFSAKLTIV